MPLLSIYPSQDHLHLFLLSIYPTVNSLDPDAEYLSYCKVNEAGVRACVRVRACVCVCLLLVCMHVCVYVCVTVCEPLLSIHPAILKPSQSISSSIQIAYR